MKRPRGEQHRDTMFAWTVVVVATVFGQRCNITATTDNQPKGEKRRFSAG
jgi:hypothetical protein